MEEREKQNSEPTNWTEIIKNYAELQKQSDDSKKELVSEILADADKKDKRKNRVIAGLITAIVVLVFYFIYQWTAYDYVSQDGEGYNYYNSDVEGDITNGTENQAEEE